MKAIPLLPPNRDALAELVKYNSRFIGEGRDPAWLRTKLDRICASPFGFLRGTFHLFVTDWPAVGLDALVDAPAQPIVGDLHIENFGAFRAADGSVVFDVNDFDETGSGSPALDLSRLATSSCSLMSATPTLAHSSASAACWRRGRSRPPRSICDRWWPRTRRLS